jgi:hypothetical protein
MPQANKPAMSSGPGALSQRTDGGPASKQAQRYISGMPNYGDGQDLALLQKQAPMSASPSPKAATPAQVRNAVSQGQQQQGQPQQQITPLFAPTQRPDEPVTAGADSGPGPGSAALNLPSPDIAQYQTAKQGIQSMASNPNSSPALKALAARFNQVY